jgi:DNA damage-inducible protein 1
MLKAHQACIDLERNCLRIQGQEIRFLSEHELPAKARSIFIGPDEEDASQEAQAPAASAGQPGQPSFPGSGSVLGATAGAIPQHVGRPPGPSSRFPESAIETLVGLGASREKAIEALTAAGGNVDVAGAMIFDF